MQDTDDLIRVMSLHALLYCERLFYLEEVEGIEIADSAVYAGRTLHEEIRQKDEEEGEWSAFYISSERLGITGKIDAWRRRDGTLIPYEHKRGRARKVDGKPSPWDADAIQVSAYAMLLEEETGQKIPEGRIRYHADNVTLRVTIDDSRRQAVVDTIKRGQELRRSTERPPVADNDRLCIRCSLAPVCLPEEERLAKKPEWEAVRLFPIEREGKTLHVMTQGASISRSGETLKIKEPSLSPVNFPIHDVSSVIIHGYAQITTQALYFLVREEKGVHWISHQGKYVAGLSIGSSPVQKRIRQYKALSDPGFALTMARKLTMAKIENTLRYILRSTRNSDRVKLGIDNAIQTLRTSLKTLARAQNPDSIRGCEGMAGRAYFSAIPPLLSPEVPEEMKPKGRSRRPPKDRFNAILSFGYSLLYQNVLQGIMTVGLEPAFGFFHTPRSSAHPLVLDIMELFRLLIWDMVVIGSVNRLQWNVKEDFNTTGNQVWLSDSGRKKAIKLFENRLTEKWRHPVINYSLSYARLIELEIRLLEKEWTGSGGLFAKMRLR